LRYPLTLLASAVAAYALSFVLTVPANPEVQVWRQVNQRRMADMAETRAKIPDQPAIFFTGGSSTAFSIDPAIIEKHCGLPAFNFGLPAGAGPRYLLHQALGRTRSGDILVVGLEPDFLAFESDYPASMISFGLACLDGEPSGAVGGRSFDNRLTIPETFTLSRPGPRHLLMQVYRGVSGKDYRYSPDDYHYHGRMETAVRDPEMQAYRIAEGELHLSHSGETLLRTFRQAADRRGVRLFYAMPWRWTSAEYAGSTRHASAALLRDIDPIIPVIDDGSLGVSTDRSHFSDTNQHLTASGSLARTSALAPKLAQLLSKE